MDMHPFRITVMFMVALAVTNTGKPMPGATKTVTGTGNMLIIIVVVVTEIQGARNWVAPRPPFFAKVMQDTEGFSGLISTGPNRG